MLKYRVLTACLLIPLVLLGIFKASVLVFAGITGVLLLYGSWEWLHLSDVRNLAWRGLYLLFFAAAFVLFYSYLNSQHVVMPTLSAGVIFWLIALFFVLSYPKNTAVWASTSCMRALLGVFVLLPCWVGLNVLFQAEQGRALVLFLLLIIWGADTGAYFSGKAFGRRKLLPKVSPGKTWEGLIGALLTGGVIALLAQRFFVTMPWFCLMGLAVVTVLFSVLGDLLESMFKRERGIKDSGHFLPGHGGLLDRIDSLTAAAPVFALVLSVILNRV